MAKKTLDDLMQGIIDYPGMDSEKAAEFMFCARRTATKYLRRLYDEGLLFRQTEYKCARYFEKGYAEANNIPERIVTPGKTSLWYRERNGIDKVPVKKDEPLKDMLWLMVKLWPVNP